MPRITDDELKALRAKNARGLVVLTVRARRDDDDEEGTPLHDFVFKKIDRAVYAKYRASVRIALASGGGTGEEEAAIARELCVWPEDKAALDSLREESPGVLYNFGLELVSDASRGLSVARDPR